MGYILHSLVSLDQEQRRRPQEVGEVDRSFRFSVFRQKIEKPCLINQLHSYGARLSFQTEN